MKTYNWELMFHQIKDFYKIIAFDNNANPPIRFYLTPKSAPFKELTWAVLADLNKGYIWRPTRLGSYSARWCPVIDIRTYEGDLSAIWEQILTFSDEQLLLLHWLTQTPWENIRELPDFKERRMLLVDFMPFIRQTPFQYQSFDIKRANWKSIKNIDLLNDIFESDDQNATITISRDDLFNQNLPLEKFIVKVLMWGYPTMGRGGYIRDFINNQSRIYNFINTFQNIISLKNINTTHLDELLQHQGLKLSTISKFLYFKRLKMNGHPCMILDQRIINALTSNRFHDEVLKRFQGMKYENAKKYYPQYNEFLSELALKHDVKPGQIELFLFNHGMNLKIPSK